MVEKVVATFIFVCQPYICLLERETNYPSAQYIESKLTFQRKCFLASCETTDGNYRLYTIRHLGQLHIISSIEPNWDKLFFMLNCCYKRNLKKK